MEVIDKHFIALPTKRKAFVIIIGTSYFLIGLIAYLSKLTNLVESLLVIIIGIVFTEMIKLQYRVEALEKKEKKLQKTRK